MMIFVHMRAPRTEAQKLKSIMAGSPIEQQVIVYQKYGQGGWERFSIIIIVPANVVEDFIHHLVDVCVLFRCCYGSEQKQFALVTYIDVVKPLNGTKDVITRFMLCWSTDKDVNYTSIPVVLLPKERPAPLYEIGHFQNIKSVVQVL